MIELKSFCRSGFFRAKHTDRFVPRIRLEEFMKPVRKVVFPVAGLGTRFLPATKAMPKEMLPVVDKPLIQYAVEEAAAAGVTDMIFITGRYKRSIEDHFDKSPELESDLAAKGKTVKEADCIVYEPKPTKEDLELISNTITDFAEYYS